jgi:hypothetical protein
MEAGVVAALAYWGVHTGDGAGMKLALGLGAPALGFGFWGVVDFHQAGRLAEPLRLIQELVVSGIAALAAYAAGLPVAGIALAALSLVYHGLVYAAGARLLEPAPSPPPDPAGAESSRAAAAR